MKTKKITHTKEIIMSKRTFTLVELLAVIGILAILAAITVGGLSFATSKADEAKTIAIMEEFEIALEKYKEDYGVYPIQTSAGDVNFAQDIWDNFKNSNGNNKIGKPYMEGIRDANGWIILEDGFGNAFQYEYPNSDPSRNTNKYALWSRGKDGGKSSQTNEDDICSWKQK